MNAQPLRPSNRHTPRPSAPVPSTVALLLLWLSMALVALGLLSACGGGTLTSGVGSGGTGVYTAFVSEGTVSGFGSVIVDGVEFDDSNVPAMADDDSGAALTSLKLGQRVRVEHSSANTAALVSVRAQLRGPLTRLPDAAGNFAVLGQTVRIVAAQDSTLSNPTVLGGVASASMAMGDELEVHGSWVFDSASASYVLVATRIETTSASDRVLLSGVVHSAATSANSASAASLRLNAASGLRVSGADAAAQQIVNSASANQLLRLWASRSAALAALQNNSALPALRAINDSAANLALGSQTLRISGVAGRFDANARTVEVQGNRVKIPANVAVNDDALKRGEFVSIGMAPGAADVNTANTAASVSLRSSATAALGAAVEIKGVTSGINWSGAQVSFKLRGTAVLASAASIEAACRSIPVGSDMAIELAGRWNAASAVVVASSVRCTAVDGATGNAASSATGNAGTSNSGSAANSSTNRTVERSGTLKSVNTSAKSLVVATAQGDFSLNWDANTYFEAAPLSLLGKRVEAEAELDKNTNQLRLRALKRDN